MDVAGQQHAYGLLLLIDVDRGARESLLQLSARRHSRGAWALLADSVLDFTDIIPCVDSA